MVLHRPIECTRRPATRRGNIQTAKANDCDAALAYVNGGGLDDDLKKAVDLSIAHNEGLKSMEDIKQTLLNDSWWETSSGPVVAAKIKYVTDEIQDWVSVFNPEAAKLNEAQELLVEKLRVAGAMIKAAYDNSESVLAATKAAEKAGAEELAEIAKEKLAEKFGIGPAYGAYKALKDTEEYVGTLSEASKARDLVQKKARQLDYQIRNLRNEVSVDSERLMTLEALRKDVKRTCMQPPSFPLTPPQ